MAEWLDIIMMDEDTEEAMLIAQRCSNCFKMTLEENLECCPNCGAEMKKKILGG